MVSDSKWMWLVLRTPLFRWQRSFSEAFSINSVCVFYTNRSAFSSVTIKVICPQSRFPRDMWCSLIIVVLLPSGSGSRCLTAALLSAFPSWLCEELLCSSGLLRGSLVHQEEGWTLSLIVADDFLLTSWLAAPSEMDVAVWKRQGRGGVETCSLTRTNICWSQIQDFGFDHQICSFRVPIILCVVLNDGPLY